jgi:hypothetical protein
MRRIYGVLVLAGLLAVGCASPHISPAPPASEGRVFELRTYTTHEGRLTALQRRFRDHTMRLFEKHGMTNIGYWVPQDTARAKNTLIYILRHPGREAARRNWQAFTADPEWQRVRAESEADGPIVLRVESVYLQSTDFSPMR